MYVARRAMKRATAERHSLLDELPFVLMLVLCGPHLLPVELCICYNSSTVLPIPSPHISAVRSETGALASGIERRGQFALRAHSPLAYTASSALPVVLST